MTAARKIGQQSVKFSNPPVISAWAAIVGPKEDRGHGPRILIKSWMIIYMVKAAGKS
jgi:hypothetical protein